MVLDGSSLELSSEETSLELSGIVLETGFVFPLVFLLEVAEVEFGFLFPLVVGFPVVQAGGSDCVGGGVLPGLLSVEGSPSGSCGLLCGGSEPSSPEGGG